MSKTLDEFFESREATRLLVKNLEVNLDQFADEMSDESKEAFMRVNLIMIRQCLTELDKARGGSK